MADKANGTPTKDFFVDMLTRDIDLNDAILDLLDNCLDGAIRQKSGKKKWTDMKYYVGYYSHISITEDCFIIEDNCGGIPRDIAEKYAFRMGRSDDMKEEVLPTVGIYGIGMKRAIFKIGMSAEVLTRNSSSLYSVKIPISWVDDETWDFPIDDKLDKKLLPNGGTRITIKNINANIANLWKSKDRINKFITDLVEAIRKSYSFIIEKGFSITINGTQVEPLQLKLLSDNTQKHGIKPFLYYQKFEQENVEVSLAVGFYAAPPSPDDIDDEIEQKRTTGDAGWTVVCNDRVVLYNDKTHLTGWGESGIPKYHTQFIGIRGIVVFESPTPKNLPMTTTKRGIDTSSEIYAVIKDKMRQGLKLFTDYTNKWKGQNTKERTYSSVAESIPIKELLGPPEHMTSAGFKLNKSKGGLIYKPILPKPDTDKPYRIIRYTRSIQDIMDLLEFFYRDRNHEATPSQIGEKCFDYVLEKAKKYNGDK